MKFLCDRCKTRYSIGDDRVRGKILKIRCKNCANVITVREGMTDGDPASAAGGEERGRTRPTTVAPQETSSAPVNGATKPPPALDEEWYVSIDGDQSGPFSLAEAQKWIASKPPTAELHCWSEGFDDWRPVDKVSHFRGLRKKPGPPPRSPGTPPRAPAVAATPAPTPAPAIIEEEPKPLFAATMASLEASAAPASAKSAVARPPIVRATPPEGTPVAPASAKAGAPPSTPAAKTNGSASASPSSPASAASAKAKPKLMPRVQTTPGHTPSPAPLPSSPDAAAPAMLASAPSAEPAAPAPAPIPGFDLDTHDDAGAANGSAVDPFASVTPHPGRAPRTGSSPPPAAAAALAAPSPSPAAGEDDDKDGESSPSVKDGVDDDGLHIGEVSRVVNLADLMRPAKKAERTGPVRRLGTNGVGLARTGSVPRVDVGAIGAVAADPAGAAPEPPLLAPEALADAAIDIPQPTLRPQRSLVMLLIGAVVLLAGIAAVVAIVLSNSDGTPGISLNGGEQINTERPDEIGHKVPWITPGSNAQPSKPNVPIHPYTRPTSGSNGIPGLGSGKTEADLTGPTSALKPEEVEDMSQNQRPGESRCWERALRKQPYLAKDMNTATLTLHVDQTGAVTTVALAGIPTDDGGLNSCLQGLIRSWRFRQNGSGIDARIKIVFGN